MIGGVVGLLMGAAILRPLLPFKAAAIFPNFSASSYLWSFLLFPPFTRLPPRWLMVTGSLED